MWGGSTDLGRVGGGSAGRVGGGSPLKNKGTEALDSQHYSFIFCNNQNINSTPVLTVAPFVENSK